MKLKYLIMVILIYIFISAICMITGYAGVENYNKSKVTNMECYYGEK
jgi:hypothetical protein